MDNCLPAWARIAPNCPIIETYVENGQCGDFLYAEGEYTDEENPPTGYVPDDFELQAWRAFGLSKGALLVYPHNSLRLARLTDKGYLLLCSQHHEQDIPVLNTWKLNLPKKLITVGWLKTRPKFMAPTIYIYRVVKDPATGLVYIGNGIFRTEVDTAECPQSAFGELMNNAEAECVLNTVKGYVYLGGGDIYGPDYGSR